MIKKIFLIYNSYKSYLFQFGRTPDQILLRIYKKDEPVKIQDIEKDGYSLTFVFQGGGKYSQQDDYTINFSPLCSDFKLFHNDKLLYQQHDINTYFMNIMKSKKEPSKKIKRPD